jgi:hypothetical protein
MGVGGQRHAPATVPPGKTRYSLCRRLDGSQSRSGRMRKIFLPPGIDPRTAQLVASRYTDWVVPANTFALVGSDYRYLQIVQTVQLKAEHSLSASLYPDTVPVTYIGT